MQWDAIIFDCDGVLVDSERLGNEVLVECIQPFGIHLTVEQAMARFCGIRMADCVAELERLRGAPLPDSFVSQFRERTAAVFADRLKAVDGALDLLRGLTVPYCVASSGPREKIELSLAITGLHPYLRDRIYSAYEVGHWKPHPGLFLHAAQAMGAAPHKCAVVEDSLPGIQAGLAAGMAVFALQPAGADPRIPSHVHVVSHLQELRDVLCPKG
jgi:HAD superfamily hydrolase (TIGR01509 family)